MDCFGLGGILVAEEDIEAVIAAHLAFCAEWSVDYPLHSSSIRDGRGKFAWLKKPENAGLFLPALQEFLLGLPVIGIASVINRPGYVARYKDRYQGKLWFMCKTAFCLCPLFCAQILRNKPIGLRRYTKILLRRFSVRAV